MARRRSRLKALVAAIVASFGVGLGTGLYVDEPEGLAPGLPAPFVARPVEVITQTRFEVIRIVDGDTFVVPYDGEPTKVRILDIDTPERGDKGYDEATDALSNLIARRTVTLHFDGESKRDNFGRLLARVTVDGIDVGETLLRRGYARRWTDRND